MRLVISVMGLLLLVALVLIGFAVFGDSGDKETAAAPPVRGRLDAAELEAVDAAPNPAAVYPTRRDLRPDDREEIVGNAVRVADYTATLHVLEADADGRLRARVSVANRASVEQGFTPFDWNLILPDGRISHPVIDVAEPLVGGRLDPGAEASGDVYFRTGPIAGDVIVVYEPDADAVDRGIWVTAISTGS